MAGRNTCDRKETIRVGSHQGFSASDKCVNNRTISRRSQHASTNSRGSIEDNFDDICPVGSDGDVLAEANAARVL